jgi:hypothetical protein
LPIHLRTRRKRKKASMLITTLNLVGPLPQYSPHPQHPRRVIWCDLLGAPVQAEIVPCVGWFGIRSWKSLGGMRQRRLSLSFSVWHSCCDWQTSFCWRHWTSPSYTQDCGALAFDDTMRTNTYITHTELQARNCSKPRRTPCPPIMSERQTSGRI